MKQLLIIVLALITSSCCNAKKVAQDSPKQISQNTSVTVDEIPEVVEDSITQTIEVVDNKGNTIIEVDTIEEAEELMTKKDSIKTNDDFHQNLTKKVYSNVHQIWDELLEANVTDLGNVNYKSFKSNHERLLGYIHILNLMKSHEKFESFSREEKLAYWINAYNALTVDLILRNYPVKSIKDIKDPWKQRLWKLGDKWYNLDEIEHQILRKMDEPRIHFAIVCASYSCPKLQNKAFTSDNLETQLTNATKEFLNDSKRNEITENSLELSKIFKWFSKDFIHNGSLIDFLNQYVSVTISDDAKISYKDYNWYLND